MKYEKVKAMAVKGPVRPDIFVDVRFSADGRQESVVELTTPDHSATVGYATDEVEAALFCHSRNRLDGLMEAVSDLLYNLEEAQSSSDIQAGLDACIPDLRAELDKCEDVPGLGSDDES